MPCPEWMLGGAGAIFVAFLKNQNAVKMVGHDDVGRQCDGREMRRNFRPALVHDFSGLGQGNFLVIDDATEQRTSVLRAYGDEV